MLLDIELTFPLLPREAIKFNFDTSITASRNNLEYRIPKITEPRYEFSFDSLTVHQSWKDEFKDFYRLSQGGINSFWYKSSIEYQCTYLGDFYQFDELIVPKPVLGQTLKDKLIYASSYGKLFYNGVTGNWQACKVWQLNNEDYSRICTTHKTLRKIYPEGFRVFIDNAEVFNYILLDFGVVSFPGLNLTGSEDIRFSGEYASEVRFKDGIDISRISQEKYQISGIQLTEEVNNGIGGYLRQDFSDLIGSYFLFPIEPESDDLLSYDLRENKLDNGRSNRTLVSSSPVSKFSLKSTTITEREKNYLTTWFMVCKGRLLEFSYPDSILTRFNNDYLSLTLERNTRKRYLSLEEEGCKYYTYNDLDFTKYNYAFSPTDKVAFNVCVGSTVSNESAFDFYYLAEQAEIDYMEEENCLDAGVNYSQDPRFLRLYANFMSGSKVSQMIVRISNYLLDYYPDDFPSTKLLSPTVEFLQDYSSLVNSFVAGSRLYLIVDESNYTTNTSEAFNRFVDNVFNGLNGYPKLPDEIIQSITIIRSGLPQDAPGASFFKLLAKGSFGDEINTYAYCLKLEKPGGQTRGFTSLDQDIEIAGIVHKSRSAIEASATTTAINLSTDNLEVKSLINNEDITPQQLLSGYYDNALVKMALIDFITVPTTFEEGIILLQGRVGRVTLTDSTFVFELRSLSELLNRPVSRKTSPLCHYQFGDSRCGLNLITSGLRFENVAINGTGNDNTLVLNNAGIDLDFVGGTMLVKTGLNNGIVLEVTGVNQVNQEVTFKGELAGAFTVGDLVDITAFCKRDRNSCQSYGNYINFGGVPVGGNFVPGLERITVRP
jgi:uncharacterized phage protein (TIGR02218 family)